MHRCKAKDIVLCPIPYIVDGSNIARSFSEVRTQVLFEIRRTIKEAGGSVRFVFDANIKHVLKEEGDEECLKTIGMAAGYSKGL